MRHHPPAAVNVSHVQGSSRILLLLLLLLLLDIDLNLSGGLAVKLDS